MRTILTAVALVTLVGGGAASADKTKNTARKAAQTTADAVVDGGRTVGRSTKALFKDGGDAAKTTFKHESKTTADEVKADGRATRDAAHGK